MPSQALADRVEAAARAVRARVGETARVAVVLGSGLGPFVDRIDRTAEVPFRDLPGWPLPGVDGHADRLVAGSVAGTPVLVLAGRSHLYEGRTPDEVTFGVRVLARLGVRTVVLTNAAGGIRADLGPGDLMVIEDHLNLTGSNPLAGPHLPGSSPRFPDMSEVYARRLRVLAIDAAAAAGRRLATGVYVGVLGPSYETPAEIRAFRALGGDAVGMSTVHEAIVARALGLDVLGLSCIANAAAGLVEQVLSQEDVLRATARAADDIARVLEGIIGRL